jgi:hypothetical protein
VLLHLAALAAPAAAEAPDMHGSKTNIIERCQDINYKMMVHTFAGGAGEQQSEGGVSSSSTVKQGVEQGSNT